MRVIPVVNSLLAIGYKHDADDLSHLKLQKLLYFLHGHYLAKTGKNLVDDDFVAWEYGPVNPSLYYKLRRHGSRPINDYILEKKSDSDPEKAYFINKNAIPEFWETLDEVWEKYGHYSATQLSTLTHQQGTPWSKTIRNEIINNELIKNYFQNNNL